jgi:hypothetical protein
VRLLPIVLVGASMVAAAATSPPPAPVSRVGERVPGKGVPADPGRVLPGDAGAVRQDFPYAEPNGVFTFVRIRYRSNARFGNFRMRGGPGWFHDYPSAEYHLSKIVNEITYVRPFLGDHGGNVLDVDDPRLLKFPVAYMSEPGDWNANDREAEALRNYLLKGGFIIFDDFQGRDLGNLIEQMRHVLPELTFVRMDGSEALFDSFFKIDLATLQLPSYRGQIEFWGIFEDNDRNKRLLAIAGNDGDLGEFWEFSDTGWAPIDLTNEAYKIGVNYLVYAMTH